eukprot:3658454-Amphidinium_carterae.3
MFCLNLHQLKRLFGSDCRGAQMNLQDGHVHGAVNLCLCHVTAWCHEVETTNAALMYNANGKALAVLNRRLAHLRAICTAQG